MRYREPTFDGAGFVNHAEEHGKIGRKEDFWGFLCLSEKLNDGAPHDRIVKSHLCRTRGTSMSVRQRFIIRRLPHLTSVTLYNGVYDSILLFQFYFEGKKKIPELFELIQKE